MPTSPYDRLLTQYQHMRTIRFWSGIAICAMTLFVVGACTDVRDGFRADLRAQRYEPVK